MNTRMLAVPGILLLALFAPGSYADDKPIAPIEGERPKEEKRSDVAPIFEPGCDRGGMKVIWAERECPVRVLVAREIISPVKHKTFVIAYRPEKRIVVDYVVKSREVEKAIECPSLKKVQVTDPATGQCSTVEQPSTEVRIIKELEYRTVREEREIVTQIPYMKEVEEIVPRKDVVMEYRTEMKKEKFPILVPDLVAKKRIFRAPEPPCDDLTVPAKETKIEKSPGGELPGKP